MDIKQSASGVSVVVPTYNGSQYIRPALESIIQQTKQPGEIIIVDDCSKDDTLRIVDAVLGNSSIPFHVHRSARNSGGPGKPLNVGISAARNDFITILEQDDLMNPDRIERQIQALQEHSRAGLCIGRYSLINEKENYTPVLYDSARQFDKLGMAIPEPETCASFEIASQIAMEGLFIYNFTISNSNFTFHKWLWKRAGGFSETIKGATDLDFALKCLIHAPIVVANRVLVKYRFLTTSLNRRDESRTLSECLAIANHFILDHPQLVRQTSFWPTYWRARKSAAEALRHGRLFAALRIYWRLLAGGSFMHHWRHRQSMRVAGFSD